MARKRGQFSKFFFGILLVLLMAGLAGFGVTNFGGRVTSVGEVGGVEIDASQYGRVLNQELRNLQQQIGQNISLEQARQFGLDARVLQRLIAQAALESETSRIGLSVGDAEVQRQILATESFRGAGGQFDRDAYEFTLQSNNLTAPEYEADIRSLTAGTMLQSAVITGVAVPATYSDTMLAYLGEQRSFSWLELNAQSLETPIPTPADADLLGYFDANGGDYVLPASKQISYVWLSPDDMIDQIEIDDTTLRAIYETRSAEFNIPERRLVERVVFATMQEAEAAHASIVSGEASFEDVVAARGLALSDVDMGDVTRAALGPAGDAVFALTEPGIAAPTETDLGPGLLRVNALLAARSIPFEDVRDSLAEEAAADNARRLVADQIAEIDDLLAGGATLEELAAETDMTLGQIDWSIGVSDGIAAYDRFAGVAARITVEDFPEVVILDDGGVFALRLNAITEERPDSFESSRAQVIADWNASELAGALERASAVILASLSGGAKLSSLGYAVSVETNATRDAVYLEQPNGFLSGVFELDEGAATSVSSAGKVVVMQLNNIAPADPNDADRDGLRDAINDDTQQSIGQDALAAFSRALQARADISLNQNAINAVHAQFSSVGVAGALGAPMQQSQGGDSGGNN